jgi:aspartyl protease family protein
LFSEGFQSARVFAKELGSMLWGERRLSRWFVCFAVLLQFMGLGALSARAQNATEPVANPELGITLPPEIARRPAISRELRALSREKCDRQAIYRLSKELEDESYRREAAESLVAFSTNCGGYGEALRRAINLLLDLSDYQRAVELATDLIDMEPNGDNGYYLRALAYDRNNRCEQAIADYSSAVELFGDKEKISSVGYESMSRCYEQLGQYCDAMLPIENWVAIDPEQHDNDQTQAILRRLSNKGKCAQASTGVKEEKIRRKGSDVITVEGQVNGVRGTFIVDTGASFVTIKKSFAERADLKISEGQKIRLNTANGAVDGYLTRAKTVKLRSLESRRVQVVIQSDDEDDFGDGVDGLIGMSFLSRFDVVLERKMLRIRPREVQ